MSLENIRKIWVLVGSVIFAINAAWIPDIVKGVFSAEGSELVFALLGAAMALYQFVKARTGENKPAALKANDKAPAKYWFPFASA